MIQKTIQDSIKKALIKAQKKKELSLFKIPPVIVSRPTEKKFGDWTTNIALTLSSQIKKPPSEIASIIIENIPSKNLFSEINEKNGFINFTLSPSYYQSVLAQILKESNKFGQLNLGQGKKVQVEFGSANPTGPLHIAFGRNLFLGDTLARILEKAGFRVQREYYVNDLGNQIEIFARSVELRYLELLGQKIKFPQDGYQGDYPILLAKKIKEKYRDKFLKQKPLERLTRFKKLVIPLVIKDAQHVCRQANIKFDRWFRESELYQRNIFTQVLKILERKKLVYKKDLALWFKTSSFGEKKDDVVIRADGTPTYFGSDIAYHYHKFEKRKFDRVVDVWGADNSGNVARLKKAMAALGFKDKLEIVIYQYVKILEKGEIVDVSKRKGIYITLEEVINKVGPDAARFFLLLRSPNSHLVFDLDLAVSTSEKNPVYYIQYAYARICSILKKLNYSQTKIIKKNRVSNLKLELLTHPSEIELMKNLVLLPEIITEIVHDYYLIHKLPFYAYDLANAFHHFYDSCRVIVSDTEIKNARLALILATKVVLKNTLDLLGISAPCKM